MTHHKLNEFRTRLQRLQEFHLEHRFVTRQGDPNAPEEGEPVNGSCREMRDLKREVNALANFSRCCHLMERLRLQGSWVEVAARQEERDQHRQEYDRLRF